MMIQGFHLTKVQTSGTKVLDDTFFSAPEGSFTVVLGESRAGKSTFLKMLAGEEKPTAGTLKVGHQEPSSLSPSEKNLWLRGVGVIFPDLELFPDKTVEENILFTLHMKGAPAEGQREAVERILSKAGLGNRREAKPSGLSSAEIRMVLALRAMIFRPKLLLADDPFQGLDERTAAQLLKFLIDLNKGGTTVVVSATRSSFPAAGPLPEALRWVRLEGGKILLATGVAL